jgi:3-oxoacyl-[acyl-carrier-protein] synthase II
MPELHPRDVVVTGLGAVSSCGVGRQALWEGTAQGRSGVDWIQRFDVADWPVRFAGEVRHCDHEALLARPVGLRRDKSLQFGLVAALEALHQAKLLDEQDRVASDRSIGAIVGSGLGPCFEAEFAYGCFFTKGWTGVRPMTVPKSMHNAISSQLSLYFGLRGGSHTVAAACASGQLAIAQAWTMIRSGLEEIVLCGGADSPLTPGMFAAWTNMKVLAIDDQPERACRPFDRRRDGLVLSEGSGMVVLESWASARRRGVPVLARLAGCGSSSDAHDLTSPDAVGQQRAMQQCLHVAGISADQVDYINAHGTATPSNDAAEAMAIAETFGKRGDSLPISSTKSVLGHALGASGALECVVCVEALRHQFVPPTINCDEPEPASGFDFVQHVGRTHPLRYVLSNSFAFGGSNACLLLERVKADHIPN